MAGLAAAVASLASSVEGAAVGSGAVARDVAELAAGVALHGLSLAVARKVVWSAALVAGGGAVDVGQAAAETTESATRRGRSTATSAGAGARSRAGTLLVSDSGKERGLSSTYSDVADLSAGVAAASGSTAAQTKSGAVSLDVAETLAVVALLGWRMSVSIRLLCRVRKRIRHTLSSAWVRAVVGLVARLLAVVAQALGR